MVASYFTPFFFANDFAANNKVPKHIATYTVTVSFFSLLAERDPIADHDESAVPSSRIIFRSSSVWSLCGAMGRDRNVCRKRGIERDHHPGALDDGRSGHGGHDRGSVLVRVI